MQLKLFVAPVKNIAAAGGDMHGFVHPHRVLAAKKELVPSGENSFPRGAASAMLAVVCRDGPPLALSLADRAWRAVTFPAFISSHSSRWASGSGIFASSSSTDLEACSDV